MIKGIDKMEQDRKEGTGYSFGMCLCDDNNEESEEHPSKKARTQDNSANLLGTVPVVMCESVVGRTTSKSHPQSAHGRGGVKVAEKYTQRLQVMDLTAANPTTKHTGNPIYCRKVPGTAN
jgi:hypothetical protein